MHVLLKTQQDKLAISIDRICRKTIPLMLYPIVTLTTILWGMEQSFRCPDADDSIDICGKGRYSDSFKKRERAFTYSVAALGVVGTTLTVALTVYWIRREYRRVNEKQVTAISELATQAAKLKELTASQNASTELLNEREQALLYSCQRVFKAFDLDRGGSIDFSELRGVLSMLYPTAVPTLIREVMFLVRPYTDGEGELDLPAFQDAIVMLMDNMATKYADGLDEAALPQDIAKKRQTRFGKVKRPSSEDPTSLTPRLMRKKRPSKEFMSSAISSARQTPHLAFEGVVKRRQSLKPAVVTERVVTETDSSTEAASVMLRTSGGGLYCGQMSGVNVPPEVIEMASRDKVLAASVVTSLISAGFTPLGFTHQGSAALNALPEIAYALIRVGQKEPQEGARVEGVSPTRPEVTKDGAAIAVAKAAAKVDAKVAEATGAARLAAADLAATAARGARKAAVTGAAVMAAAGDRAVTMTDDVRHLADDVRHLAHLDALPAACPASPSSTSPGRLARLEGSPWGSRAGSSTDAHTSTTRCHNV